jgi:hypothetical protein
MASCRGSREEWCCLYTASSRCHPLMSSSQPLEQHADVHQACVCHPIVDAHVPSLVKKQSNRAALPPLYHGSNTTSTSISSASVPPPPLSRLSSHPIHPPFSRRQPPLGHQNNRYAHPPVPSLDVLLLLLRR